MTVQTTYPGVYVVERPSGVHTISAVSTSVTAFVGGAGYGPTNRPVRVTSVAEYERTFGPPVTAAEPMGYQVRHYFMNGGSEAVIVRVAGVGAAPATVTLQNAVPANTLILAAASEGTWANVVGAAGLKAEVTASTTNPGDLFNLTLTQSAVQPATGNVVEVSRLSYADLSMSPASPRFVNRVLAGSPLAIVDATSPPPASAINGKSTGQPVPGLFAIAPGSNTIRLSVDFGPPVDLVLPNSGTRAAAGTNLNNALVAANLGATAAVTAGNEFEITSNTAGPDSAVTVLQAPNDAAAVMRLGLVNGGAELSGAAALLPTPGSANFAGAAPGNALLPSDMVPAANTGIYSLNSRMFPRFNLLVLAGVTSDHQQEVGEALAYCRDQRAFLIVDTPEELTPNGWITSPPNLGSIPARGEYGAVYYPRLQVFEARPGGGRNELNLPASGAVAGVYASTDRTRGVWKAPAGQTAGVVGASGLTSPTSDDVSGQLNPFGVNVLRTFPLIGTVVWGARTLRGSDAAGSEFKYVPVRRTTDMIASSLFIGTAFAVFEPNDPTLWAQLRLAVGTFMRRLFEQGAFQQSEKRSEADSFFVVCDATVNPQSEIDLGRVNVVVGFAPLKPAEFVIVTITQISSLEA